MHNYSQVFLVMKGNLPCVLSCLCLKALMNWIEWLSLFMRAVLTLITVYLLHLWKIDRIIGILDPEPTREGIEFDWDEMDFE